MLKKVEEKSHVAPLLHSVSGDQDVPGAAAETLDGGQGSELAHLRGDCRAGARHRQHHCSPLARALTSHTPLEWCACAACIARARGEKKWRVSAMTCILAARSGLSWH
jgi:hypothetical protein